MATPGKKAIPKTVDMLLDMCVPEPNTGCYLWVGSLLKTGYAQTTHMGRGWRANRLIATLLGWEIDGLDVCHKCDTRACINPQHLFVGTRSDNMQDCSRKGRSVGRNSGMTHCRDGGHELVEPNIYKSIGANGKPQRHCRICHNEKQRAKRAAARQAVAA